MYEAIKYFTKRILPQSWLLKNELFLRKAIALKYRGNSVACNICDCKLSGFIVLGSGELLCPACGSLPRNRRLWRLLNEENLLKGRVLDFSPSRCLSKKMGLQKCILYTSSDYAGEFEADKAYDITAIDEQDSQFDLVLCFHVLEHVPDDYRAMQELLRVLKPGGRALIQTPFKEGEIYENHLIITPVERLAHFGQEDHVRVYSVKGLADRLRSVGFSVENRHFKEDAHYGMKDNETILIALKKVA